MTRKHLVLFYGFCSRDFTILKRYPLNLVGTVLSYVLVFLLIFWGGKSVAPDAIGESLEAIVIGYFLLATVQSTFTFLSGMINSEAQYGTLEQLYVAPFRFSTIMFTAVLVNIVFSIGMGVVTLSVILFVTGESLVIDLFTIAPVLSLTLLHAIGLSFLLAGVALLYKRIRSLFQIVQFVFIGLISFALTGLTWPKLLPVGQGAVMLHRAMADGTGLFEFPVIDHVVLIGTAVIYLTIGYLSFYISQHEARRRGLLDDY